MKHTFHYAPKTIGRLFHELKRNMIDINPSYQREIVWNDLMREKIIITLTDGYPMPPLNFSLIDTNKYECVDGKNRIHALWLFLSNELRVRNKLFSDSTEEDKDNFLNIEIQICVFQNLDKQCREDYFRRIQGGVQLSKGELLWSMEDNAFVNSVKKYRTQNFSKIVEIWDTYRYKDMFLLFNLAGFIMSDDVSSYSIKHSTTLSNWVGRSKTIMQYDDIMFKVDRLLNILHYHTVTLKMLDGMYKKTFILDLARFLVFTDYAEFDFTILDDLVDAMCGKKNSLSILACEYNGLIKSGIGSAQYSSRLVQPRFDVIMRVFFCK